MKVKKDKNLIKVNIGKLLNPDIILELSYDEKAEIKLLKQAQGMSRLFKLCFDPETDFEYNNGLFFPTINMSGTEGDLKKVINHFKLNDLEQLLNLAKV